MRERFIAALDHWLSGGGRHRFPPQAGRGAVAALMAALLTAAATGGFALSAGYQAESTPNMAGTVPGTAPAFTSISGGIYNSTLPSPTTGQTLPIQLDAKGVLLTGLYQPGTGNGITTINPGSDGQAASATVYEEAAVPFLFNGSTMDRARGSIDTGAIQTLTSQGAGTLNSADQTNFNGSAVNCVFNQSAHTGTPSTTFAIQFKDTASGLYVTVVTSAAITADATPTMLSVGAAANVANSSDVRKLSRTWRTTATVGGASPVVTATVGCSVVR